jgi:tetratricopeptide (TPR) repeat protein
MRLALVAAVIVALLAARCTAAPKDAGGTPVPGDDAFARMEYGLGATIYDSLLQCDRSRADILWRVARLNVCLGDIAPEDQKTLLYERAEQFARRSISADSASSEAHSWRAAALGSLAMNGGAKQKFQLAREIKHELDLAIASNPDDDAAHSILGSFYRAIGNVAWLESLRATMFLGGLPAGGYEESEKEFQIAIGIAPDLLRHHFELGLLYVDRNQPEKALQAFSRAAVLPPLMASDRSRVERAKTWVTELQKGG